MLQKLIPFQSNSNAFELVNGDELRCYSYDGMVAGIRKKAIKKSKPEIKLDISDKRDFSASPRKEKEGSLQKVLSKTPNIIEIAFYGSVFVNPLIDEVCNGLHGSNLKQISFSQNHLSVEHAALMSEVFTKCFKLEDVNLNCIDCDADTFIQLFKGVANSTITSLDIVVANFSGRTRLLSSLCEKQSSLTHLEFMQVTISDDVFINFCEALVCNTTLKSIFFFRVDFLNDKLFSIFCNALLRRKLIFRLNASLASYSDVGGFCLGKLLRENLLQKLNIRGSNLANDGLKTIAANMICQESLQRLSLRILYKIPKDETGWYAIAMALENAKGLKHTRLTSNCIDEVKFALDKRLDIAQSWRDN